MDVTVMSPNILITGGAGFIGSRLARALAQANPSSRIWILDNLHPQVHGPNAVPPEFPQGIEFIHGDVADRQAMHALVEAAQPEVVYHLAAETGTGQSYDEVTRYCEVNVTGTANLIEAVRAASSRNTNKIVLAASRAVYGEGGYVDVQGRVHAGLPRLADKMAQGDFSVPMPAIAQLPVRPVPSRADLPVAPASIYASTKLMQEYLLTQAGEGASWSAAMLRFQNVYGPGQSLRNPYTGVLSIFSRQLMEGKRLSIYEDGLIARDFVYVDDVVNALVLAGEQSLPHGTILDIGTGHAVSILDVAKMLMRHLGYEENLYSITGQFRVGDIRHACADIEAAQRLLGWQPQVSVEVGLKRLAEWARIEFESQKTECIKGN
jgi:dTDP-L-rhamnose 4-epimerase